MTTKNFPTSQTTLYIILRLMWQNCLTNISTFGAFKAKYKPAFVAARLAEIDEAEALPNEEMRALPHKEKRSALLKAGKTGCSQWQSLKLYIDDAFENPETYYNAAGYLNYEAASNNNWPSLNELLKMGSQFIADNLAALQANENMPDTFQDSFDDTKDQVKKLTDEFTKAKSDEHLATDEKNKKNNSVYSQAISMGADGQHLFEDDEEMRKLFSFEAMREIVSPPGASEVTVTVYAETDGVKTTMKGADVSIEGTDKSGVTDDDGKVTLSKLPDGDVKIKITADGFNEDTISTELTGTHKHFEAVLNPLFTGEMVVGAENGVEA